MYTIFYGLLFGLLFVFSFGPAFFALIQTSLQQGFRPAVLLAIGISISDIFYACIALLGMSSLLENPLTRFWMGIAGTIFLIVFGIYSWFKSPRVYFNKKEETNNIRLLKFLVKGSIINGLNPFIMLFWIGMISLMTARFEYGFADQVYFFAGVLIISPHFGHLAFRPANFSAAFNLAPQELHSTLIIETIPKFIFEQTYQPTSFLIHVH